MAWLYHLWLEVRVKKREKPNDKRPWDTRAIAWKEQSFDFYLMGFPWWLNVKESACIAEDPGSIPGLQRSTGEGNDKPLQYTCLENPMDRRAWWATVHEVARVIYDWVTKQQYPVLLICPSFCNESLLLHLTHFKSILSAAQWISRRKTRR